MRARLLLGGSCALVIGAGCGSAAPANGASVLITPAAAPSGARVELRGSGYPAGRRITVRVSGHQAARPRSDRHGRFTALLTVPRPRRLGAVTIASIAGAVRVKNTLTISRAAGARSTELVTSTGMRALVAPSAGAPGARFRLALRGLGPGATVDVKLGGQLAGRARRGRSRLLSAELSVPRLGAGRRQLVIRGRRLALSLPFDVLPQSAVAPPAPRQPPRETPGEQSQPTATLAAAGDIACPAGSQATATTCRQESTAGLLGEQHPDAVAVLGDAQYEGGALSDFTASFEPSWGRFKSLLRPAVGNHEYGTSQAAGYFAYFGAAAGDPSRGYYSFDLGTWHLVALNSNCSIVSCAAGSAQEQWLRADLAAHPAACTLAYWHHPRFSSGLHGDTASVAPLFSALYEAGADVVLSGHDHDYERFAPQDANGGADAARGVREFVVGTGGKSHYGFNAVEPNSQVRDRGTFGVLALALEPGSYSWRFVPEAGSAFSDSGRAACH